MEEQVIRKIQTAVLTWYKIHGRHDLPWRRLSQLGFDVPYGVMVSEFMLQQTQVDRVELKFLAFMKTFPTIKALAKARPSKVITLWSGLGYNRRAVMLHQAAIKIVADYRGVVPRDVEVLKELPGIGDYTAAAIAAFGYNLSVPVLDTNIERFFELLFWGYTKPAISERRAFIAQFIPPQQSRNWHSGLMDSMAHVRKIKSPRAQQTELLKLLNLKPTWPLPKLSDTPLKRPKQSAFHQSKRYYRGQIIKFLTRESGKRVTLSALEALFDPSPRFPMTQLLAELKRDRLISYQSPLTPQTFITLDHG